MKESKFKVGDRVLLDKTKLGNVHFEFAWVRVMIKRQEEHGTLVIRSVWKNKHTYEHSYSMEGIDGYSCTEKRLKLNEKYYVIEEVLNGK